MKNIISYIIVVLAVVALLQSCEDNRLDNIPNDKIYLINPGLQQAQIYNFGTYEYNLPIYKSGLGTEEASLEFLIDPTLLSAYNETNSTNYQLLPENCYTLVNNAINISINDVSDKAKIVFNTTEILKIQENGDLFLLPLKIKIMNNIELKAANENVLLVPEVIEPYIAFAVPGFPSSPLSISVDDPDEFNVSTKILTNYKNIWDLNFTVDQDPEALSDYNSANGSSFIPLPTNAFNLHPDEDVLAGGISSRDISITLIKKNLINNEGINMFGEYIIPLRIKTVSKYGVDPVNGLQFFHVSYMPDLLSRTEWKVIEWNSCISEEPDYDWLGRTPDKTLDDDLSTFWGSKWDNPKPLPYFFVIDMKSTKNIFRVGFTKPNDDWRGNMKSGYFEISNDLIQWSKLTDWNLANNDSRSLVFDVAAKKGRYLRLVITEAFDYADNSVGAESGAQMDLAEIYAWGLNVE